MGVFARYSTQKSDLAENTVKSVWSLGMSANGSNWGRGDDAIGVGYGQLKSNTDARLLTLKGISEMKDEAHFELYYRFGISDHFTLTPDVQIITNNGGRNDQVAVYGVRGQLNF